MATIYQDDQRSLDVTDGKLTVPTNPKIPAIYLYDADITAVSDPKVISAIRAQGQDPSDKISVRSKLSQPVCFPSAATEAISQAIAAEQQRVNAIRNDPANIERNRISRLLEPSERLLDEDPGAYYGSIAQGKAALAQWQIDYPEAARKERKQSLLDRVANERRIAKDALWYDCDGSFTREYRQQRHDEIMVKAEALQAEAEAL